MRICGAVACMTPGSTPGTTDDFTVALYENLSGTPTLLASTQHEGAAHSNTSAGVYYFDRVELTPGTVYGVVFKAANTNAIDLRFHQYAGNAHLGSYAGADFYGISRNGGSGHAATGGSSFTEDNDRAYGIWPIFDQVELGGLSARARNALGVC